jgi:hypothetical protein
MLGSFNSFSNTIFRCRLPFVKPSELCIGVYTSQG